MPFVISYLLLFHFLMFSVSSMGYDSINNRNTHNISGSDLCFAKTQIPFYENGGKYIEDVRYLHIPVKLSRSFLTKLSSLFQLQKKLQRA